MRISGPGVYYLLIGRSRIGFIKSNVGFVREDRTSYFLARRRHGRVSRKEEVAIAVWSS